MLKLIIVPLSFVFLFVSCKQKESKKKETPTAAQSKDSTSSFPVMELLREDIGEVQKVPYYIYKKNTFGNTNKVIDSIAVSPEKFSEIIAPLLKIDIASSAVKDKFKETVFQDLSTQSISIVTTSIDGSTEVKSVTALLNDETNKLKSFFAVMESKSQDTLKRTTYYWKAGKSLTIGKSTQLKGQDIKEIKEFINWNDIAQ